MILSVRLVQRRDDFVLGTNVRLENLLLLDQCLLGFPIFRTLGVDVHFYVLDSFSIEYRTYLQSLVQVGNLADGVLSTTNL